MSTKFTISIPQPCHENWQLMTPIEKGKFCNLCKKNVIDFTTSTDREIINSYNEDAKLCGRFLESQLNREMVLPKEKNTFWLVTSATIISFLGFGIATTQAQKKIETEQTDKKSIKDNFDEIVINGQIYDDDYDKLSEVLILVKNKKNVTYSDENGKFSLRINKNDTLQFYKKKYIDKEISFEKSRAYCMITLEKSVKAYRKCSSITGNVTFISAQTISQKRRTFFGRIFQSIGKWFK